MKLAILYAGQGSQHPGMGKDLYERYPAFREAFNAADLDFDLESVCFDDPESVLNLTQYTQPCMVAFAAGVTAVLKENGVKADDLAGLSLGEYSALEAAGVFTAKQAVELAAFRGKAMADAAKGIECGMTAVMNLDRDALAKCCEEASALGCVQICNYNCPGQLVIGGVTPSPAMLEQVLRDCPVPVNVLIRPRFGDFLYTDAEMDQMCREIDLFRRLGVNGVVIGALTPDGALDMEKMRRMMDCAGDMEVTLHRAFDMSRDPFRTLEDAVSLGCRTVLTSGQAPDAAAGIPLLARLRRQAAGRIHIMAGCGVKWWNIQQIHHETGIRTFHTTGRRAPLDSGMTYRKSTVSMGLPTLSEYEVWQTDPEEFARCAAIVHGLHEASIK